MFPEDKGGFVNIKDPEGGTAEKVAVQPPQVNGTALSGKLQYNSHINLKLKSASTDDLVLKILDNRPDPLGNPRAIYTVKIPVAGPKAGTKPRVSRGQMLVLGID